MTNEVPPMIATSNAVLVPSSSSTLTTLGYSTAIAAGVGAAQVLAVALPNASEAILQLFPVAAQGYVGPFLTTGLLALQAYLISWAKHFHNTSVDRALSIPTSRVSSMPTRG